MGRTPHLLIHMVHVGQLCALELETAMFSRVCVQRRSEVAYFGIDK